MIRLYHQPTRDFLTATADTLTLRLQTPPDDSIAAVSAAWVRIDPDNEEQLLPMQRIKGGVAGQLWEVVIPQDPVRPHTAYVFKVAVADDRRWLAADGEHPRLPPAEVAFRWAHVAPPAWVSGQIFYQIFPDRFCNGDPSLDQPDGAYHYLGQRPLRARAWHEQPQQADGPNEFFHGDLPGIVQRLDYLQEQLGITAIYLNPVFHSDSNHKYDTIDYFNVDPRLGGNDALIELRTRTRERGIRLLLDGVLNHTSVEHPWFQRARAGELPYSGYYLDADGDYASWKGHSSLPVLDYSNAEVVAHCYAGDGAVLRHWLRPPYRIDGWRLDVIHMLGEGPGAANNAHHVAAMRQSIKAENAEAYLLGEHFFEATQWLQGDQEDAAMNYYGFMHPLWMFLAGRDLNREPSTLDGREFAVWLREARAKLPFQMARCQLNLLNSHDTPRLLTLLQGNVRRMIMAIRLQMTYLGVPCLYYGDEIGLQGGEDPDCRRPFPWDERDWNQSILHATREAIGWRRALPVLSEGGVTDLEAGPDHWVFARVSRGQAALVGVNRGTTELTLNLSLAGLPIQHGHWVRQGGQQRLAADQARLTLQLPTEATELWVLQ
ncbi:maltodextrin glucosidase [Natronospirillum operosum]|uniref:Maltodextrin glucosidase n=1 Tax=Natronospirillum operosum TaxID=2759953 RepID=A0A4Z0W7Q2_9GAMM|nr:maltodextrin glucosidase [Natronospirillum operosum]TGG90768.1 maltodextrin glucosidase [Natronospirillum operosum]